MKLELSTAPYIHSSTTTRRNMLDLCFCMLIILGVSLFYYGSRAMIVALVSVASGYISEVLSTLILFRKPQFNDWSSIYASLAVALLLPATIPLYVVVVANVFSIFMVKHPFGGTFQNIFNPVACALAFVTVSYSGMVLRFPVPFSSSIAPVSAADSLMIGGIPNFSVDNTLIGLTPTAIGTGSGVLILACAVYLAIRRVIRLRPLLITLGTITMLFWVFPRTTAGGYMSVFYEVFGYPTLFYLVFVLSDSVTSPVRSLALDIYSVLSGVVIVIFRHFGSYAITEPFAILLLNSVVPMIDICVENVYTRRRRRAFERRQRKMQQEFVSEGDEK